ncbi:DUF637 domain-containing protein [Pannonibacter phragmitetus]|uniref:DUF637 domain-containing protein n=1 Tax=Pannonibacter phragmitetus TaxID=121719 RepID=UPI003D2ED501
MGELRNDPALAGKVDWQAVETRFEQWDYKEQGLTEAGAALVTLVATALTAGSGGLTASLSSSLATSLGVAGNVALEAALQAGVQALINKTAVALVNNRGNLGGALEELGSSATLRSLVTSMVTAGLTAHLMDVSGIGQSLPRTAPMADRILREAQRNLIKATVNASVETVIQGGGFGDNLMSALRLAAADMVGKVAAEEIGQAKFNGDIGTSAQLIAHAALGCATGAIQSGDCAGGAAGGVAGELVAQIQLQAWVRDKLEQAESLRGQTLTAQEAMAIRALLESDFERFRAKGVDVARLAGGLAAALAGGDVDTGANTGGNAAENNAIPLIVWGMIAAGAYVAGVGEGDPLEGLARIGAGEDPLSQAMAYGVEQGVSLAMENYPDQTVAVLGVLEVVGGAVDATVVYIDEATGQRISKRWNELDPHLQNQLKGGTAVVSIFLPSGSINMLKRLKLAKETGRVEEVLSGAVQSAWSRVTRVGEGPLPTGRLTLDPAEVSFSQATVSGGISDGMSLADLVASMRKDGWKGEAIDIVNMPDGAPTSMDNRRLLAARQAGVPIEAVVRNASDPLSPAEATRFRVGNITPKTWGEAIELRVLRQGGMKGVDTTWPEKFPNGSIYDPDITRN